MRVFRHELQQNRKLLMIWTAVVAGMIFIIMLIFPQMESQVGDMTEMFANMGGFSAAFGMDKISFATPMGFYGVEGGAMMAIGGGMLAAILGGNILCKEEGSHTAEFLLTMPMRRENAALQKLAAVAVMIVIFNGVCMGLGIGAFAVVGEEIAWNEFLLYHIALVLMQLEIGALCFCLSAFLHKVSMGVGIGVAMLFYFLQMFVNVTDKLEWLKYVTPYYYSDAGNVFPTASVEWGLVLLGMGYAAAAVIVGLLKYGRKDLAV